MGEARYKVGSVRTTISAWRFVRLPYRPSIERYIVEYLFKEVDIYRHLNSLMFSVKPISTKNVDFNALKV